MLARSAAERQLASREALNGRLTTTITFAGALLAVALTLGQKAGAVHLHHGSRTLFGIGFVVAVLLLTGTIVLAIWALQPERRPRANPSLLKHYGTVLTSPDEVAQDAYRFEVALATRLGAGNSRRAARLLWAQKVLGLALAFAAANALILFLGS